MEHVVCGAGEPRVLAAGLPDELEHVVDAGEDVVHEDDGVEELALGVAQLVQRDERGVAYFREIFDAVIERAARALRRADDDAHADGARERVEDAQERLGLVRRAVLVDGDEHVVVPEDGGDAEERGEDVGDDVERVVEVDGEEVLVLGGGGKVAADHLHVRVLSVCEWIPVLKERAVRRLVADEGSVAAKGLLDVVWLGVSCALFGVVRREGREELEHAEALLNRGQRDRGPQVVLVWAERLGRCALPWLCAGRLQVCVRIPERCHSRRAHRRGQEGGDDEADEEANDD